MATLIAILIAVWPTTVQSRGLIAYKLTKQQKVMQFASLPKVQNKPAPKPVLKPTTAGFKKGWCTYWVAIRRHLMGKPVTWRGNAGDWFEQAKKQGYTVGNKPQVGAIYVTRAENSGNAPRAGHVALVIDVKPSGITLEEMNVKGFNRVSTRDVSYEKLAKDRVGFVY